jgi:hypothetical protein
MGTRSTIALEFADGTVEQVYCHWDGYLEHNGKILQEHYSDPFKLRELMDLGGLSSLRPNIGVKHAFSALGLPEAEREAFEAKHADSCTFYGRDRGEDVAKEKFADFADYVENHQYEEYEYILRNVAGKATWYVKCHDAPYVTLEQAFIEQAVLEDN